MLTVAIGNPINSLNRVISLIRMTLSSLTAAYDAVEQNISLTDGSN